jgi:hypothetical protein
LLCPGCWNEERTFYVEKGVMIRVGQNRIDAPYMTVYLATSLPEIPYIHRICMVLANSIDDAVSCCLACLGC